ncbi:hypothetical protein GCM10027035_31950 [Emticicia sediminis]
MLVQVLSEASLVPNNEMQSETASDDFGTSQIRLAPVVKKTNFIAVGFNQRMQ